MPRESHSLARALVDGASALIARNQLVQAWLTMNQLVQAWLTMNRLALSTVSSLIEPPSGVPRGGPCRHWGPWIVMEVCFIPKGAPVSGLLTSAARFDLKHASSRVKHTGIVSAMAELV